MHCRVRGKTHRGSVLGVLYKPRIPFTVTICQGTKAGANYFLLENHLCIDSATEREGGHLQASFSTGKRSDFCWVQLFGENITLQASLHLKLHFCCLQKQGLLPALVKHYFRVSPLSQSSDLSSEQERKPETSFEKLLIQYLSPWNLRETTEVGQSKILKLF